MSVNAVIPWNFVSMTNDTKQIQVEGETVGECLENLIEKYPTLKPDLFNKNGRLHNDIILYVNKTMTYPNELAKPVQDGDELAISVLIGGG
jgi:molybdopterin converting factor small subunit